MKTGLLFGWLRATVACAAFGFSFAARAETAIPASAYVQDGLITQWDGFKVFERLARTRLKGT